jgi:hypothetical protein
MKKYLEQRVEALELEISLLKAKFKLEETKSKSTSSYLNNYPKYDPFKDYMHNSSVNLMSDPDLETAFSSSYNAESIPKSPLVSLTVPPHSDSDFNSYQLSASIEKLHNQDSDFPPYPDIIDSWDTNPEDVVDEYGFKLNCDPKQTIEWGFLSKHDKEDKNFLEWIKTDGKKAYEKFKQNNKIRNSRKNFNKC